jgi:NAD(P)-dependent dehydrogenase (short-subunit alcohol dehydrogenase family)
VIQTPLTLAHTNEGFEAAWRRSFAINRFGQPEDIAKAVTFLASDFASWITGIDMLVDGGTHLRGLPDYVDHLMPGTD